MSSLLILGWTEEVPDFAEAVQPVQGVQPKIQLNRNSEEGPSCTAQRRGRTYNKDLPKWVDRLDGANNDEHFSRPGSRRAPGRRHPVHNGRQFFQCTSFFIHVGMSVVGPLDARYDVSQDPL